MEKTIRFRQYDLKCDMREYDALKIALNEMNSIYTPVDKNGWENYLILDKFPVRISLKKDFQSPKAPHLEERVLMAVSRTTFFEPKFVKRIVKRLKGNSPGSGKHTNSSMVDLFLDSSYEEFQKRKNQK
ncbi:MAG: hypothetical protein WC812_03745 [Candidatus Pacearchaeota archaeon]|jgi:hypothetical protein